MNTRLMHFSLAAVVALTAACASNSDQPAPYLGGAERGEFVGGVMLTEGTTTPRAPKVIVTSYALNGAALTAQEALIAYGAGGSSTSTGDDFRIELLGPGDRVLQSYAVGDPRKFVVEQQGIVENPSGVLTTRFRFEPTASRVRVKDRNATILAETDVRGLIAEFCRRAKEDPDCRSVR